MDLERSKELRDYLRTTLKLPFAFPEPEEEPEFYDNVYTKLKSHYPTLCDALQNAYRNERSLHLLVKQEWGEDLGEIPNGESYADKLRNTIEWMEADGCLLEFIAAAHRDKARNTKLNTFVRKILITLLEMPISTQQIPPSKPPSLTSSHPTEASAVSANHYGPETSNGATSSDIKSPDQTPGNLPAVLEENQDHRQTQPTPFPRKIAPIEKQSHEDPIVLAYGRTRTAREKMQSVYEMFQSSEKVELSQIIEINEQVKQSIDGISDLFVAIPIPDYPALDYRLACEERYICERISIVSAYFLQGTYINSPAIFQSADKEFKKVFLSLQNLENFINQFQEQIQLSDYASNPLLGNSS